MYFHAGQDFVLNTKSIIGIFDLDTAGASRRTQAFFRGVERSGAVVDTCAPGTVPRSFAVTDAPQNTVYLCALTPAALRRRAENGVL